MREGRRFFGFTARAARALGGAAPVICLAAAAALAAGRDGTPPRPQFRFHGAVIRVTDMQRALDFYSRKMGFAVLADGGSPRTVRLGGEFPLYLRLAPEAPEGKATEAGGAARAVISFQTADITARTAAWRKAGIEFLEDAPHAVGVGRSIPFRDPFGTALSLLQQTVVTPEPFAEPRVYNSGFYHPDVAAMRPLYVETLGFVVRTERYFPPALPLGHADGSFGFMLHERAGLGPADTAYPDGPGVTLVFETPDMAAAAAWLKARGVAVFRPRGAAPGGVMAFRDGSGVVSELWSAAGTP